MARIHFICRAGLGVIPTKFPEFESGNWDITEDEAKELVGGKMYLHESKNEPSYFGGKIANYRIVEIGEAHSQRVVFKIVSERDGKGVDWEGASHGMAWTSGCLA